MQYFQRFCKLLIGLFVMSLAIVLLMQANVGYAPWEVFSAGVASLTKLRVGTVTVIVGLVIVLIDYLAKEKMGFGTILNMLLLGGFMNLINGMQIIPLAVDVWQSALMLFIGLVLIGIGSFLYMTAGFGAGPRDTFMVMLMRKTGLSLGICRGIVECTVALIGYLLGGQVGIGTIVIALSIGYFVQITYFLMQQDPKAIQHETFNTTMKKMLFINK
ncbi:MAG: hypothetical protein WCI30_04475 [Clostridia bacterium]